MAVVTNDYTLLGYLKAQLTEHNAPFLAVFDDFDSGLDWIKARRAPETQMADIA